MKIEIVLNPKTFGKKASIVWEPDLTNGFVQWWISWYVDRLLFTQPFISKRLSLLDRGSDIHGSENISKFLGLQEKRLKDAIVEINTFVDPKNYFPVSPKQISLKGSNKKTRKLLNTVHRYFVRSAMPAGPWNSRTGSFDHRRGPGNLSYTYNWEVDAVDRPAYVSSMTRDYKKGDATVRLEGDFDISDDMRSSFKMACSQL